MSALRRVLDTYLDSGRVRTEEVAELANEIGASYVVRSGVHVAIRDGRVVFAAHPARLAASSSPIVSIVPCATCGALPVGGFLSGGSVDDRRRYACGPHEPIWPMT